MTLQDSMALIQQKRPQANPIPAFYSQLQEYEKTCMDLGIFKSVERSKPEAKRLAPIGPSNIMPKKQRIIGPAAMPASTDEKDDNRIVRGPELPSDDVADSGSTTTEDERTIDERRGVRSQLVVDKEKQGGTPIIGPHLPS